MPYDMHETAPTQFVQAGNVQFAYRRLGSRGATPLLLCNYFAAHMDDWDPNVTNGFAAEHDVILFDYPARSCGASHGTARALRSESGVRARLYRWLHGSRLCRHWGAVAYVAAARSTFES
jgi:pimeloyl-ACP methyl ester carboxylesterase